MGRGEAEKGDSREDGQLPRQSSGRETRQARAWTRLQSPFISFSNFFCLFLSVLCQEHCASLFALAGLDSWGLRSHTSLPETWGGQLAAASSHPGRSGGLGAPDGAFQRGLPVLSSSEPDREVLYLLPFSTVSPVLPDCTVALPEPTGRESTQLESHRPSAWICSSQCRAGVPLEWTVALEKRPGGRTSARRGVQPGSRWHIAAPAPQAHPGELGSFPAEV